MKKVTTEEFIRKAVIKHGNKYDYSQTEYKGCDTKCKIRCPIHGEFEQTPYVHLITTGCGKCGAEKGRKTFKNNNCMTFESFEIEANKTHGHKYKYIRESYNGSSRRVSLICPKHGKINLHAGEHLRGVGCKYCAWEELGRKKRITQEEFIKKSEEVHGDTYKYDKAIVKRSTDKLIITCKIHGNFLQAPAQHLDGQGCPKCGMERFKKESAIMAKKKAISFDEFIKRATKIHNGFYNYSKIERDGFKANNPIVIGCPKHGEFICSIANNHLGGKGCYKCGREKTGEAKKLSNEELIIMFKNIHGDTYDYSLVNNMGTEKNVEIICKKHGSFFQTPNNHKAGKGCRKCVRQISKPEIKWLNSLNIPDDEKHRQVKINLPDTWYKVDGFDPETKTIYEMLGDYFHGNPKVFEKDKLNKSIKKTFGQLFQKTNKRLKRLYDKGYKIYYIWENDFKNGLRMKEFSERSLFQAV